MPDIHISIKNKIASGSGSIVLDNTDYSVVFSFDDEWAEYPTKTMRVSFGTEHIDTIFEGDTVLLPRISGAGAISIGVYAGDIHTTTPALIECRDSILTAGGSPAAPPEDVYAQIMEKLNSIEGGEISPEQIAAAVEQYFEENPVEAVTEHDKLTGKDAADQHPITAVIGLQAALDGKQPQGSYLTAESDPTVPEWAKQSAKPEYTAEEVGADPSGTAASAVSEHNVDIDAHNDIRLLIEDLARRFNALADSEDIDLDQLSEIIAYIQDNRELIDSVTTSKVSYTDIVDNLTTNVVNKPLSAAQGVALKQLIDAITVPTKLSQLEDDASHRTVTDTEKTAWSAKSDYNPNLLHNADWAYSLVNQRGHSGAVSSAYCIDRWIGSGTVTPVAGQYVTLAAGTTMTQRMEIIPAALAGKTCTFSIDVNGTAENATIAFPATVDAAANVAELSNCTVELGFVSVSSTLICGVTSTSVPYIKITAAADINVRRVFLEYGTVSHMAETPPKNYADILLTCQRYFVVYGTSSLSYPCLAVAQNATVGTMIVNLPCSMRMVNVTPVITGTPTLRMGVEDYGTIESFSQSRNSSANSLHGIFNAADGAMVAGTTYIVRMAAGTNISFSADL